MASPLLSGKNPFFAALPSTLFIYLFKFIILLHLLFCECDSSPFWEQGVSSSAAKAMKDSLGGLICCCNSTNKYKRLDAKLQRKMVEVKRGTLKHKNFRSINSIIMRFPLFKEELKNIRGVFEQYDEDSNGTIDCEELKKCLHKLQLHLTEKDIDDLFHSCDMDESEGIQFNEFIVLLCLIYLLVEPSSSHSTSKMGSPQLDATFDTIVEAFLFLDKNGDGMLNKKDMVKALNGASAWEKSPAHITRTRFREMDWDKNGKVSFREFVFAFTKWVGIDIDTDDEIPVRGS
ncbi:probable calcium-binding protein CML22 isoform X2 [Malania oleifera]|uniref:probable calcium-binding protein CML22 isoform X2 n=1 Tax=Malania oleifera TaxID=397392 RepID=UPI0025AEC71D|nr:probable calcium-binding protein CML22 isoform X2 [Malania oleifera]